MHLNEISGLEEFEWNPLYKQFLEEGFDLKASLKAAEVTDQLAKLSTGIALLDKALHHQVSSHYEELLSQATEIETLEGILASVHRRITHLLSSGEKLRERVTEPYQELATATRKLRRLHLVCDLLRNSARIVRLVKRLRSHMSKADTSKHELTKAASCLAEIEQSLEEVDLTGITVIEEEMKYIRQIRIRLHHEIRNS